MCLGVIASQRVGAKRRPMTGSAKQSRTLAVIASEAKQSIKPQRKNGLLRGACHRARIRATRWLAMTAEHTFATSPRHAPEPLIYLPPKEGVGNAGCPWHPQPRVRFALVEAHE